MRWKPPKEPAVLLGWNGKYRLVDLVCLIGTPDENLLLELPVRCDGPADYRRLSICSKEEVAAWLKWGEWLKSKFPEEGERCESVPTTQR